MAAYSKTTWTNSSAPAINADNLNKIENGIEACSKATVYSTTEQVVGTWTNGKPIYRKVVDFGTLPNNTSKLLTHNIPVDVPIKCYGYFYRASDNARVSIPMKDIFCWLDNLYVCVQTGQDRTNATAYLVIEYTKTTD